MKVLVYGDAPVVPTGFGSVVRNVFGPLIDSGFFQPDDLTFYGVNFSGEWHPDLPKFHCYPANIGLAHDGDPYGRQRFVNNVLSNRMPLDILWVNQDHFTVAPFLPGLVQSMREQIPQGRPPFAVIFYVPIDNNFLKPSWVSWLPELIDFPVAYMNWSARTLTDLVPALDGKVRVIYHGTNPEQYFPVSDEARHQFRTEQLQLLPGEQLIVSVNRNQPRKDPARTMQIFKRVLARVPTARLYMHMNVMDNAGFDLREVALQLRLPQNTVRWPENFNEGVGVTRETLNFIYNAADVFLTTARGEGFGLSLTENMCVGRAISIAPKHTSFAEILADDRGRLVAPLKDGDCVYPLDNDQFRPMADIDGMAEQVIWALKNPEHARGTARRGAEWARSFAWSGPRIAGEWQRVFEDAWALVQQRRGVATVPPAPRRSYGLKLDALQGAA